MAPLVTGSWTYGHHLMSKWTDVSPPLTENDDRYNLLLEAMTSSLAPLGWTTYITGTLYASDEAWYFALKNVTTNDQVVFLLSAENNANVKVLRTEFFAHKAALLDAVGDFAVDNTSYLTSDGLGLESNGLLQGGAIAYIHSGSWLVSGNASAAGSVYPDDVQYVATASERGPNAFLGFMPFLASNDTQTHLNNAYDQRWHFMGQNTTGSDDVVRSNLILVNQTSDSNNGSFSSLHIMGNDIVQSGSHFWAKDGDSSSIGHFGMFVSNWDSYYIDADDSANQFHRFSCEKFSSTSSLDNFCLTDTTYLSEFISTNVQPGNFFVPATVIPMRSTSQGDLYTRRYGVVSGAYGFGTKGVIEPAALIYTSTNIPVKTTINQGSHVHLANGVAVGFTGTGSANMG